MIHPLRAALNEIERHREELLREAGVFPIASYGWLDADSVDPENAGHAMRQTSQSCEVDGSAVLDGGLPNQEPSKVQIELVRGAPEFLGAMLTARYNSGMALCTNRAFDPQRVDDDEFWHQVAITALRLGIVRSQTPYPAPPSLSFEDIEHSQPDLFLAPLRLARFEGRTRPLRHVRP